MQVPNHYFRTSPKTTHVAGLTALHKMSIMFINFLRQTVVTLVQLVTETPCAKTGELVWFYSGSNEKGYQRNQIPFGAKTSRLGALTKFHDCCDLVYVHIWQHEMLYVNINSIFCI